MPFKEFLREQQLLQWRFYLNNRRRFATRAGGTWVPTLHEPRGPQQQAVGAEAGGATAGSGTKGPTK